ncbi:MAG: substrate-binding domain-containing protein [Lachnospiraceae bacterium]|nr:substrate-binding domain-containing protein [Lachnospiraceae bacterium]
MAKSVKLADIAAKLNVSAVTVSKALSDQKGVSEELRERIKNLAQEMGYRPPSAGKQGKGKKSYNVGVLIAERHFNHYESYYLQVYQMVATRAVAKECFTMLEIVNLKDEQEGRMPRLLQEDKVDGLIIIGLVKAGYLAKLKQLIRVPYVFLDFYDKENDCDAVISDSFYGMYKLTNYLFEQGHKKIAYVGTLLYTDSITDRYLGYCKSLLEHGQTTRQDWVIDDRSMETGDVRSGGVIRLPEEMPTAFACNCDLTAGVLVEALKKEGYRVPEDVSVVGFDNYLYPSICSLGITTYEIDIKEMARKTINKLIKKMSGENDKSGMYIVDGHIVLKESVRRLEE